MLQFVLLFIACGISRAQVEHPDVDVSTEFKFNNVDPCDPQRNDSANIWSIMKPFSNEPFYRDIKHFLFGSRNDEIYLRDYKMYLHIVELPKIVSCLKGYIKELKSYDENRKSMKKNSGNDIFRFRISFMKRMKKQETELWDLSHKKLWDIKDCLNHTALLVDVNKFYWEFFENVNLSLFDEIFNAIKNLFSSKKSN